MPARKAPRNSAAYSSDVPAQIAIESCGSRAPRLRRRRHPVHQRIERGVIEHVPLVHQRRMTRPPRGVRADQVGNRAEGRIENALHRLEDRL